MAFLAHPCGPLVQTPPVSEAGLAVPRSWPVCTRPPCCPCGSYSAFTWPSAPSIHLCLQPKAGKWLDHKQLLRGCLCYISARDQAWGPGKVRLY